MRKVNEADEMHGSYINDYKKGKVVSMKKIFKKGIKMIGCTALTAAIALTGVQLPGSAALYSGSGAAVAQAATNTSTNWQWPTSSRTIKSDWPNYPKGAYHGGTDFPVALNSPVYSTCDGEVVDIKSLKTSYGKHIKIKATVNGNTVYIRYCHLNGFNVNVGDKVKAGQQIAISGSTGNSTGPHLHYEVRNANDTYNPNLNPNLYLPGSSYSFTTVDTNNAPKGCFDLVEADAKGGYIRVAGWAYDPDASSESINVHVYVGGPVGASGSEGHAIEANMLRTDVNNAHGITGNHGFDVKIPTNKTGSQAVYVYAIDSAGGSNTLLGSKTVTVPVNNAPKGCFDLVSADAKGGYIRVAGWAYDPDTSSNSISVHVYIGGPAGASGSEGHAIEANTLRTDVNNAYSITGKHGFDVKISTSKTGKQTVYVYAIDSAGANNTLLGSKTITVSAK